MTIPPKFLAGESAVARAMKTVTGGIVLTLVTVGLVEIVNVRLFPIPKPSSLYLLAVATAAMLGGIRSGLISALIVFAYSAYATHLPGAPLPHYADDQTTRLVLFGFASPGMALIVGGLRKRNDDLVRDQMRRVLATEQAQLAAGKARLELEREHRIAATLQNALVTPLNEESFPGIKIGSCYEPAWDEAEIGGDFYDVIGLDRDTVAVAIGDVSGKGLAAAAKTAEVKYTLRSILLDAWAHGGRAESGIAGDVLRRVNDALAYDSWRANVTSAEPFVPVPAFVCLTIAIIETSTGNAALAVAGMEPPLVLRRSPLGLEGEIVDTGGLPLGVSKNVGYPTLAVRLEPGDALVFATDGITEARRTGSHNLFGIAGVQEAAEAILAESPAAGRSLNSCASRIVAASKSFAGAGTLKDDACVLLVERRVELAPAIPASQPLLPR